MDQTKGGWREFLNGFKMGLWTISDTIAIILKSSTSYKNVRGHMVLNHGPIRLQPLPHRVNKACLYKNIDYGDFIFLIAFSKRLGSLKCWSIIPLYFRRGRDKNFLDPSLSDKVMRKIKFQKCTFLLRHALVHSWSR